MDEIECFLIYGIFVVIYLELGVARFCRKSLISRESSVLLQTIKKTTLSGKFPQHFIIYDAV